MRSFWIGAFAIVAAALAIGLQTGVVARTGFFMGDFRAFYCAARVASQGANPYHTQPLRACEAEIGPHRFFERNPGVTIPAPLPGYAIAALVPLALLPFALSAGIWALLLLFAFVACVAALARFASLPWEASLAVVALSLGAISLPFGEVVPVALAGICAAAYFAQRGRARAAALCAAGAMIEPHLGLPVCLALAIWMPATRLTLALALAVLGALSVAALGMATNFEYFTSVLPAHALSEVTRDTQYSLTAVLAWLGASDGLAIRAGTLWYVAMLAGGAIVAGLVARKSADNAWLVAVPPAFAVFGGTFIHITQIAAALPAAALLAGAAKGNRALAVAALLLLVVPWVWVISPALLVAPLFAGYLTWHYWNRNVRAALIAALAVAALCLGLAELAATAPQTLAHLPTAAIDPRLAEATWSEFTRRSSTSSLSAWMLRVPTWLGLIALLALITREAVPLQLRSVRRLDYRPHEAP